MNRGARTAVLADGSLDWGKTTYMIKVMAVYDEDPLYAARLADYVNQKEKLPFTAMAFSSLEQLTLYGREHPIEILLAGEGAREKIREHEGRIGAKQIILLCEGELTKEAEEETSIYKYQSGDCIMREVMACYCSHPVEPGLALLGARALVLGIYSPVNRCGKSSLAVTFAQVLSKTMSVLYLSFEEFSGLSRLIFGKDQEFDLSDVLYTYKQGTFNWMKLKTMVSTQGGMDYIPPPRYGGDLNEISPEDMALLIGRISRESGYDRLVIDMGQMGRGSLALLEVCDAVYMPVLDDRVSAAKLEEFDTFLSEAEGNTVKEKICRLHLPPDREQPWGSRGGVREKGTYDNDWENGYMDQLLWGELGDLVRRLLDGTGMEYE